MMKLMKKKKTVNYLLATSLVFGNVCMEALCRRMLRRENEVLRFDKYHVSGKIHNANLHIITAAAGPRYNLTSDPGNPYPAEKDSQFCVGYENLAKNHLTENLHVVGSAENSKEKYVQFQSPDMHPKIKETQKLVAELMATAENLDSQYVLFSDYRDVYFTEKFTKDAAIEAIDYLIKQSTARADDTVFFSADYICWPDQYCAHIQPKREDFQGPYFVNAGVFGGKLVAVNKLLNGWVNCLNSNEQEQGCAILFLDFENHKEERRNQIGSWFGESNAPPKLVIDRDARLVLSNTRIVPFTFHNVGNPDCWMEKTGWGLKLASDKCYTWSDPDKKEIRDPFSHFVPLIQHFNGGMSRPQDGMLLFKKSEKKPNDFSYISEKLTVWGQKRMFKDLCDPALIEHRYSSRSGFNKGNGNPLQVCWD